MDLFERQLLRESREVRLLPHEKQLLRERVVGVLTVEEPVPSPYTRYALPALRGVALSLSLLLVVIGTVTYGAQYSRPGDFLHPFEVGVVEEVEQSLQFTPTAKHTFHTKRLEERLTELRDLNTRTFTPKDSESVLAAVTEHAEAVVTDDTQLPPDEELSELARTTALLAAHEEVFDDLNLEKRDIKKLAEKAERRLEVRIQHYIQEESDAVVAAGVVKKLDLAEGAIAEVKSKRNVETFTERFEDIEKAVKEGEIDEAYEKATKIEVELLKESYLRTVGD